MSHKKRKTFKRLDKMVDLIFAGFLLIVLLYSGYSWWDNHQMYAQASSSHYAMFRPSPVYEDETLGFEELRQMNADVFGWIEIFGTGIDYPLLQTTDNHHYVYHSVRNVPSRAGAIFLDFRNAQQLTDFNNIIYGHDMARGVMFGDIARFEEEHFFDTHRFGTIFNGDRFYGIEIFAFMLVDAFDTGINGLYNPNIRHDEEKYALFARIEQEALLLQTDIFDDLTTDDQLIMLSTCTPLMTNGRHLLIGRLMNDIPENTSAGQTLTGGLDQLLAGIGEFGLMMGGIFTIILTAGITFLIADKQKKKKLLKAYGEAMPKANKQRKLSIFEEGLFFMGKLGMITVMLYAFFTYAFGFVQMVDASMAPAVQSGDFILFQRIGRDLILATDVIVIDQGNGPEIRRVVAVEGDVVNITERGLEVNGRLQNETFIFEITEHFEEGTAFPLIVPYNQVFVLGDSRTRSVDSRIYGPVRIEDVLGSVVTVFRGKNL